MIYEIRTYNVKPGSLPEVEKLYGESYEFRKQYSPLWGFFHTELGPLNQIVHIWIYESLAHREEIRLLANTEANAKYWPPKIQEFIVSRTSEILTPFAFVEALEPGQHGPIFEMRQYDYKPGTLPNLKKTWEAAMPAREERSKLGLAGDIELGNASGFVHIWPYRSMDERLAVRSQAVKDGVWPPVGHGPQNFLSMTSKILVPAAFSPLQ